ncbi:MAG: hypothetical protein F4118_13065 [Acidimicrobiaceae bacterium]|nr:hypothetical protein [Acidimicrobiaceae bacterium]
MKEEFAFFNSADPEFIDKKLDEGNVVCAVLNENLHPQQLVRGTKRHYILPVEYEGEKHWGLPMGCHKTPRKRYDMLDPKVKCGKTKPLQNGVYPVKIVKDFIDNPLCFLLHPLSDEQIEILKRVYKIIDVNHDGQAETGMACSLFDPNKYTEPQFIGIESC